MKQSKIKVLLSKKERNNNYILNINIKKKLLGSVQLINMCNF